MSRSGTPPRWRLATALSLLGATLALARCQPLNTEASSETCVAPPPGSGSGGCIPVLLETPEIDLSIDEEGEPTETTTDPCVKVQQDAIDILTRACATCHDGPPSIQGAPLTFILEPSLLSSAVSPTLRFAGVRYVIPGDPDHSLVYQRGVITGDMPPPGDAINATTPFTISDSSVIREWILSCLGPSQAVSAPDGG